MDSRYNKTERNFLSHTWIEMDDQKKKKKT